MPRLHLVTGHRVINRTDAPFLLYLGHDADAARRAQDAAIAAGHALIAERYNPTGPVTRYGDKDSLRPLPAAESLKPLIPVELGEGEAKVVINVETEAEADFLKMLAKSVIDAGKMIGDLSTAVDKKACELTRLEALLTDANSQITKLEADLKAAQEASAEEPKSAKKQASK